MNKYEFSDYQNKHIKFELSSGEVLKGVVFNPMNYRETGKEKTTYSFIPTKNMVPWKKAKSDGEKAVQRSLEEDIDIRDILSVELIDH